MKTPVEDLVKVVCERCKNHGRSQNSAVTSASLPDALPPYVIFGIAQDVVRCLGDAERLAHLNTLLRVTFQESGSDRSPVNLCTAAALIASTLHSSQLEQSSEGTTTLSVMEDKGKELVVHAKGDESVDVERASLLTIWEEDIARVLSANPPYNADTIDAVHFVIANLAIDTAMRIGANLVSSALETLRSGQDNHHFSVMSAVDLLSQLVAQLHTWTKNSVEHVSDHIKGLKSKEGESIQKQQEHWTFSQLRILIADAAVQQLSQKFSNDSVAAQVTRKLVIPLLSFESSAGSYSSSSSPMSSADRSSASPSSPSSTAASDSMKKRVMEVIELLSKKGLYDELIVLIASLFDFLFPVAVPVEKDEEGITGKSDDKGKSAASKNKRQPRRKGKEARNETSADGAGIRMDTIDDISSLPWVRTISEEDFRTSNILWVALRQSLFHAIADVDSDTGHRAVSQLRVMYLLKRITHLCELEETEGRLCAPSATSTDSSPVAVRFHPLFSWVGSKASAHLWNQYLLVMETLSEYGLHIILPTLPKIDFLAKCVGEAFSEEWLEMLLLKMIVHPNIGVRKLGLWKLWHLDTRILKVFSNELLFSIAFCSAADPRLCSEMDRSLGAGSFLDSKAFEGEEEHALPRVEPITQQVEKFYYRLLSEVLPHESEDGECCAVVGSAHVTALLRFMSNINSKSSRFCLSVFIRVFHYIAETASQTYERAAAAGETVTHLEIIIRAFCDAKVLKKVGDVLKDGVQVALPFWIVVRANAIVFDALLCIASVSPIPLRSNHDFWTALACCGPNGDAGGNNAALIDACGVVSSAGGGSGLEQRYMCAKVLQRSKSCLTGSLVDKLVQPAELANRLEDYLASGDSLPDVDDVRELFFLSGVLQACSHEDILMSIAVQISKSLTDSLQAAQVVAEKSFALLGGRVASQSEKPPSSQLSPELLEEQRTVSLSIVRASLCLSEFHRSVGTRTAERAFTSACVLPQLYELVFTYLTSWQTLALQSVSSVASSDTLASGVWVQCSMDEWDAVVSAAIAIAQMVVGHDGKSGETTAASCAELQIVTKVNATLAFLVQLQSIQSSINSLQKSDVESTAASAGDGSGESSAECVAVEQQQARVVLARNGSRLLQSLFVSLLPVEFLATCTKQNEDGSTETSLDCWRSSSLQLDASSTDEEMLCMIDRVVALFSTPLRCTDAPCSLATVGWPVVLAQYAQYLYTTIFSLCTAAESRAVDGTFPLDFLKRINDFALSQLDMCWGSTMASVYDLLLWILRAALRTEKLNGCKESGTVDGDNSTSTAVVQVESIVSAMFERCNDVKARERFRVTALAFNALRYCMRDYPELVKRLTLTVLDDAHESERSVYYALVALTAEVARHPDLYWDEYGEILLHAAVLFNSGRDDEEPEACFATLEPLMLDWSPELRALYPPNVRTASIARCLAVAAVLYCCTPQYTLQTESVAPEVETEQRNAAQQRAKRLTLELLMWNVNHPSLTREPCMPNSDSHRCRIRVWQLLCALIPLVGTNPEDWKEIAEMLIGKIIGIQNMGSVRRFMEVYTINLFQLQPSLYVLVDEAMQDYGVRAQVSGTFGLIAGHVALSQIQTTPAGEGPTPATVRMTSRLVQLATSHQHLLRTISHCSFHRVYRAMREHQMATTDEQDTLFEYIDRAPEHVKNRVKHDHLLFFDAQAACEPRQLFCVQRNESRTILKESVPAIYFERIRFVEAELRSSISALYPFDLLRTVHMGEQLALQEAFARFKRMTTIPHLLPQRSAKKDPVVSNTAESSEAANMTFFLMNNALEYTDEILDVMIGDAIGDTVESDLNGESENIQRKVGSWWTSEVYNELHPRALKNERQSIVVVGSLLENPVNIAGLCRCGEIFTVESIVIPERKVFEHPHFVAAARSAELWIPWEEVAPRDLPEYLHEMRRNGYTIVGIEQTSDSVSIANYTFPSRVVVVLGAEGRGIPAHILPHLDVCVEIPQYGLIRSLNVHVTGAIIMYEFTRQQLMPKQGAGAQRFDATHTS